MRRIAATIGMLSLLAGQLVFAGAATAADPSHYSVQPLTPESTVVGAKSTSGAIARSDPTLLGRTDSTRVNVMIKYDYDATASYKGGVGTLAATSPQVTGKALKANKDAVKAYESYTTDLSSKISARAQKAAPGLKIQSTYVTAYGGVGATIPANQIGALLKTQGVAAVQKDSLSKPNDDNTNFIGATAVWPSLGGSTKAGSNVIFGDLDTGVWPENPMLSPTGIDSPSTGNPPWACQFGDGSDVAHLGQPFACNHKLIGAYAFLDTYMAVVGSDGQEFCNDTTGICSARDSEGHGTHTTTTAAGSCTDSAVLYGVERGPVCGIAPGAHVIEYRVCMSQGCFNSDSVNAIGQAITDGVNVINYSIGPSAPTNPYSDPVDLAFLDAFNAGISVNTSGGNSGPGAGTVSHGGPWETTVGASTGPRAFTSTLHLTADGGASLDVPGVTLTNGISTPTAVVLANTLPKAGGGTEDAACQSDVAAGAATGKVVVCARGGNGRIDKGRRVLAGGAAGMILYNQSAAVTDLESDNHYLPAIQTQFDSNSIATFVSTHTNTMATWAQGTASPSQPDVMASFSSRGPEGDFIKPDITAPGVQVLAGTTPQPDQTTADNGPVGNNFMAIAGTSMSSPHAAGVSILVKAAHPDWTPAEIKSALMTSAVSDGVVKEDGTTPANPFDMGSGSIRADRAVDPTLVFDETFDDYVSSMNDVIDRVNLNIASLDATTMSGLLTAKRVATNVSGKDQDLAVSVSQPAGVQIIVTDKKPPKAGPDGSPAPLPKSDSKIHLKKNGTTDIWITIIAPDIANGQYFGRITLDPKKDGYNSVTIPVAFVKTQGKVSLTNTCSPLSFAVKTEASHCTVTAQNLGSVAANASLTVTEREKGNALQYVNIGAPGAAIGKDKGVQWSGSLSPALAPTIVSYAPGTTPNGGYLPLSALGVAPITGVGDDTMSNFNVPAFFYGSEAYTRVGVGSNGDIVVGGSTTGADATALPQHFPDPARPNNVIAPLWTDLNPTAGGALRIAILTDDPGNPTTAHSWLVIDWGKVKNFNGSTTHSFQIWIQLARGGAGTGPSSEEISVEYGTGADAANAGAGDSGTGQNWGAENRDASSGQNAAGAPADGSSYRVMTSPPVAGGSVSIPFDVMSKNVGVFHSDAALTSDQTTGTTVAPQSLTVTP